MSVSDISFLISPKSDVFSSGTSFHGICALLNSDVKIPEDIILSLVEHTFWQCLPLLFLLNISLFCCCCCYGTYVSGL